MKKIGSRCVVVLAVVAAIGCVLAMAQEKWWQPAGPDDGRFVTVDLPFKVSWFVVGRGS